MAKSNIITGLDLGSQTIKIICAAKKKGEESFQILSQHQEDSSGIRRGIVVDVAKVTDILISCVRKAEELSSAKISNVYATIGGSHLFCLPSHGLISVSSANKKISEEDVNRVLQAAQTFSLPSNKELLEVFPKEFIVDGEKGVKEVSGMQGVRLEVDILAIGGFSPYIKNSTQAISGADLRIADIVPAPLASARGVLTAKEKELGALALDIGAGTTNMAVFEEGSLVHLAVFPIGSEHITNDIAVFLKTDTDTAEKIKLEFGACSPLAAPKNKKSKSKTFTKGDLIKIDAKEPLIFSRKSITQIINARVSEIFGQVQKELKNISKSVLPGGVVLTGGGSRLPYIKDLCKKNLKLPCRIGLPKGFFPELDDPRFAAAAGLVLAAADYEEGGRNTGNSSSINGIGEKLKKFFRIFIP